MYLGVSSLLSPPRTVLKSDLNICWNTIALGRCESFCILVEMMWLLCSNVPYPFFFPFWHPRVVALCLRSYHIWTGTSIIQSSAEDAISKVTGQKTAVKLQYGVPYFTPPTLQKPIMPLGGERIAIWKPPLFLEPFNLGGLKQPFLVVQFI